ncbi:hypothetical protein SLS64_012936 [Diaporthe eres]
MDPLSALGAAAAVTQFVDYAVTILRDTREIIKSVDGQTAKHIELSSISMDLTRLAEDVDVKSKGLVTIDTDHSEQIFLRLCGECREIAKQLLTSCARLQSTGVTRLEVAANGFVAAVKGVWNSGKIEDLHERLDQVRQQMMMAVLTFLWYVTCASSFIFKADDAVLTRAVISRGAARKQEMSMSQFAQRQADAVSMADEFHKATRKFNDEMIDLVRGRTQAGRNQGQTMVKYIMHSKWDPREIIEESTRPAKSTASKIRNQRYTQTIVNSLLFETINHREDAIPEAYMRTSDWIFQEPYRLLDDNELWYSFPQWLHGPSDDIYWITGKPGAGKSTLVKYILADPRLKPALMKWSQQRPLIVAGYFSWNAGTGLQKSHAGLIRTLLHQCLQLQPDLVPRIFPRRWAALSLFAGDVELPEWEYPEILAAFKALIFEHGKSRSFAFVIDGLDEFEDNHQQLIELLQLINREEHVKIRASSRPLNSFRDAFAQNPKLQLEHLTKKDIDFYVRDHFDKSKGFRELTALHPEEAGELLKDIVEKSKGVFLWVSVVVRLLLENLSEGDKVADLRKTLANLPDDLRHLFDHIWGSIDSKHHGDASQFFQMMTAAEECDMTVYCLSLYFADDDVPVDMDINKVFGSFLTDAIATVQRRLSSRTRGILEVYQTKEEYRGSVDHFARVDYLHRTAKEWVMSRWDELRAMAPEFDPFLMAQIPIPSYISAKVCDSPDIVTLDVLKNVALAHIPLPERVSVCQGLKNDPKVRQDDSSIRLNLLALLLSYDQKGALTERLVEDCISLSVPEAFQAYIETLVIFNTLSSLQALHVKSANVFKGDEFYGLLDGGPAGGKSVQMIADNEAHSARRRLLDKALPPRDQVFRDINELSQQLIDVIEHEADTRGGVVDATTVTSWYSFDVISTIAFGQSFDMLHTQTWRWLPLCLQQMSVFLYAAGYASGHVPLLRFFQWLLRSNWPSRLGLTTAVQAQKYADLATDQVHRRGDRLKAEEGALASDRKDIFGYLMRAEFHESADLASESSLLIAAGSDATRFAIAATMFYLLQNPDAKEKAVAEVRALDLGTDGPSESNIASLKYLRACVDEAMRLSPPKAGSIPRETGSGGIVIDGVPIPKGMSVATSTYSLHRDPQIYKQPFEYRPERWLERPHDPRLYAAFTPFIKGPRACPGKAVAYVAMQTALFHMLREYDIESAGVGEKGVGGLEGVTASQREQRDYPFNDWIIGYTKGPFIRATRVAEVA